MTNPPANPPANPPGNGAIWVWLTREPAGGLASHGFELLYEARGLAGRLGMEVTVISGDSLHPHERTLAGQWGATGFLDLGAKLPPHPIMAPGVFLLESLLDSATARPRVVLFPADSTGKVTAPFLARELDARLVTAATGITVGKSGYVIARPILGGRREALVESELERPLVVTLIPGAVGGNLPASTLEDTLEDMVAAGTESPFQLIPPDPDTVDLTDAERIVAFGRGAFDRESIALVEGLARVLGAVVAGSRPAADEGWLPFSRQIGLTGAIVHPRLYLAVGISGAPYHMVGVKEPELLVAINSDPNAPILAHADLGIVGDLRQVVPALIEILQQEEAVGPLKAANSASSVGGKA